MMNFVIQNIEFILTVIGLAIAVIAFFFTKDKKSASRFIILLVIIVIFLTAQYFRTWDYVKVPNVTGIPYNEARAILRSHRLRERPLTDNNFVFTPDDNAIVIRQQPDGESQCRENEVITLFFLEENKTEAVEEEKGEIIYNKVEQPLLTINIENIAFFNDGYYYEYANPQNPSENFVVDFDRGIEGTFSYSRELTAEEKENWMHGGKIYDSDGQEIGYSGNYPTFWSNPDGKFAVQFPKDLQPGEYTYELYQFINNQQVSDKVTFVIH